MSAREMFEELGYELAPEGTYAEDKILPYRCYKKNIEIAFYLKEKQIVKAKRVIDCIAIKESELKAIIQQCKELGWLEEEKLETNLEHHFEYVSTVGISGVALVDGRVVNCSDTPHCSECDFSGDCSKKRLRWLASPYRKKYKLTKFENDLLQSYVEGHLREDKLKDIIILNEMKEKGYFKGADENATIGDILDNCEVIQNEDC